MCLQETRLNDTFNTTIRRYSIYRRDLPSEHPAGGVCIIVNNQIPHSSVQLNSSLQAIAVRVSMHKVLTICSIYIPPSSPIIAADVEDLLRQLPAPALICGDFNGHNLLWGSRVTNPRGRTIENIILHNNLCLFNDTSMTYLDLSAGTYSALDLTLCHPSLFQDFTWMVDGDLHTSDHFPIHVKGNGPPVKGRPQRWKLHKADWTVFKQLCAEHLNISSFAEISDQYFEFITILLEVAEISIPKTSQYPKRFNKPWFNKDCKNAVRERKRLLRKFSLRPTSDNLSSYRQAAAAARRTIRQAKRESWRQYVSKLNSQSSIKSAWDRLRKIRGKGTSDAYKHLNVGGTAITSQFGIANALGQSFCKNSSSENCTGSFRSYKNRAESYQLDFKTTNTEVYNQVFSLEELRGSLRASKDTSPGPDSIHYQMLKHLPDCSLALMLNIFNTIWITGAIPSSWREATVIPIPKPGKDHTDPSNYRPIALTSCICKTMERMINCRLTYYLESNNILTRCQSGFRRHRSTIDHLVRFETLVREAFIRREHLAAVFFDLEKAYETTWKYGILRDLFNSGLRGRMPIFINHFLTNRKFRVRVGTTFSDHFDLEMGVPQGSILSVTLFSLKINDIVNHVKSGTQCFLYVDDLVVAYASKSISTIERHLQLSLNKIERWTNENGFKFSSSKTVSMHFCLLTRPHHDPQLRLGSSPIPLVNFTRFLGLILDKKLNFLNHLKDLKLKCFKALNLLRILSNTNWGADRKVMLRFYRSLIRSKLDYGSVVYGSARKSYLRALDPIHNQGLRLSLGAFRTTPAESLYVEAHEPSLYLRREKLSLQYACRLRANPENPCYDVTFHPNHRETFARRQNSIPTFGLRVLPLFEQIGLPLGNIARCVLPSIPPWTMNRPIINFSLTGLKKGTTPSYVYLYKFLEVSDSYHGYHHIYTDGSRQNDEVAAAAISSLRSLSSRLPDKSSIFSAESKALLLALDIVENSTYGRYIILSDSLSCLMALDNMNHVGISGNEKADLAAKSALSLPVDPQFISYRDFYMYIFKHILSIWQSKWDGEINNKLHAIKPKLGEWALAYRKSHLSAGTYSALDLTLCHPSLFQDFTWMVDGDLHTSDHFPIHVKGNGPPIKGRPQRWKLHKADWTMFKQLCAEQLNISSFAEISDQYSEFITILLEVAEISIPKTSQYPKRFNKPWFNKDCKDAVRERKRLLRKFSLRPTSDNLSSYRQAAAAARRTIRQAKRESWRQYVSKLNSQSSIKSAWDRLRKIRGKGTSDAYKHLNVGGTAITSQFGIANALGQSFCKNSSSENCTGSFRSYKNRAESHQLDFKTTNTEVYNQVFSLEELRRSLRASKDTSPGPDSIHYQMLKHLPDCSLALMLNIFNTIWITGAIPSSWLEATNPTIFLLNIQSGFRRHRSTIDHLVKFETLVREAFVRREHLAAVFFDLEKAYETTWKVRVGTTFSDYFDLEMGVPQGSILSVTLFSLKINDIVNHVKSGTECFLYVDDLVVAYASKSISTIERHLQLSLNKIEKWTNENGFKFSSSKTVSMHFCLLTRPHHDPQLRLGSSPIPLVNSTRFLGLIFDKKLNFLKHMQVLKSKCLRALNLLRILSNTNWGADRKVMLRFYRSLIRSKLDYGSVVYGSARKSYLRVLDPVHNQGLRLSLGAFRTTPAESLYVEAHEPSLYLRREKLSLQYACRLRANPENPCYDVTFHPNHRETFARRQNSIPTFGLRVLPLFEQIGLPLGNIARCVLPSIPPWTMHRPIINFSLTGLKKGTTPSYVYLYKFLEVSDSYHGYHHIYTDGSRQNDEVAAAAISTLTSLSSRLPDKSSIFSAESKALLLALDIVENSTYGRYIILSDSLSCLMALDNMKYSHPTICDILVKLHLLTKSNHVIFCWLPSHVGISGNEKADFAAKSALSLPVEPQSIYFHDFYMYISTHILSIWQSKWDGEINNKLHAIKPKLGEWALSYRKLRKEESILCRLRVGHTYLTHSFLLRNEAQPVCGRCQQPLTVRHVLVDCVDLTSVRSRFYSPLPWEEFFQEVDICKIFDFLKYLNVYNRL
ncbi:RNA-directed DNA polymerase from mobile element jockey [Nymphon striatum]|nr:RNA-directed DNA polymerase from mobile element jockey [Nymphon striatum]